MGFVEKIEIKLSSGNLIQWRVFNIPVLQYERSKTKDKKKNANLNLFPSAKKGVFDCQKRFFYLKIDRWDFNTVRCFQKWINTINELNADFVVICDKPELQKEILRKITFNNSNIKFIKSERKLTKSIIGKICSPRWYNAGCAHLTTFLHAKANNIKEFWNIDADDTMFLCDSKRTANLIKTVETYAKTNNVDVFSLDMWRSRTRKKHWTFRVTYTRNIEKIVELLKNETGTWNGPYEKLMDTLNVDWYFTYLKDSTLLNIQTFYVENCRFLHCGDFLGNIFGACLCYWENGYVYFPFIDGLTKNRKLSQIPIADDCVKFDLNISEKEGIDYTVKNITYLAKLSNSLRKLWHVD